MSKINLLDTGTAKLITSSHVIPDLASIVKELVENAIDSRATVITVKFKQSGIDSIEVADNGTGISEEDLDKVALPGYTSKISTYEDVETVMSYGFRGQALSAICPFSKLQVVSATAETLMATKAVYNSQGHIESKSVSSGTRGTIVTVSNLFYGYPVRRKELERSVRKEYQKALAVLQEYGLMCTSVKFTVVNIKSSSHRDSIEFSTSGNGSLKTSISSIYGAKVLNHLMDVDFKVEWDSKSTINERHEQRALSCRVVGVISLPFFGHGRTRRDQQNLFINARPCTLAKVTSEINSIYKEFNKEETPSFILDFRMDPSYYDVNVSTDKRTLLVHDESQMLENLGEVLREVLTDADNLVSKGMNSTSKQSVRRSSLMGPSSELCSKSSQSAASPDTSTHIENHVFENAPDYSSEHAKGEAETAVSLRDDTSELEYLMVKDRDGENATNDDDETIEVTEQINDTTKAKEVQDAKHAEVEKSEMGDESEEDVAEQFEDELFVSNADETITSNKAHLVDEDDIIANEICASSGSMNGDDNSVDHLAPGSVENANCLQLSSTLMPRSNDQIQNTGNNSMSTEGQISKEMKLAESPSLTSYSQLLDSKQKATSQEPLLDIARKKRKIQQKIPYIDSNSVKKQTATVVCATIDEIKKSASNLDNHEVKADFAKTLLYQIDGKTEEIESSLTISVRKSDFENMEVIGQFNTSFILVKSNHQGRTELFIVDQHASDEKFNFEDLQKKYEVKKQRLMQPIKLDISVVEEITVVHNLDVFRKNGFDIIVNEDAEPGKKCQLVSLPFHKQKTFGVQDLNELIGIVSESGGRSGARCSKVRDICASEACRKSVMFGDPLNLFQMQKIISHMSGLDKPWHCPHGRPTLRHLMTIRKD